MGTFTQNYRNNAKLVLKLRYKSSIKINQLMNLKSKPG